MASTKSSYSVLFNALLIGLYAVTFSFILYFLVSGWSYYTTPLNERPHHELYQTLKPGGFRSHGLGVLGSTMLILLLLYSVRKRVRSLNNLGLLRRWLNIHIFFGITGPVFIILHSTLKLNGLVSVSFWSMIAVALSGVVGRYLYIQIPRNLRGQELSLNETQELNLILTRQLQSQYQLDESEINKIEAMFFPVNKQNSGLIAALFGLLFTDITFFWRGRRIKKLLSGTYHIPTGQIRSMFRIFKQKARIDQRILLWQRIHRLFHYWHVFHRPFAVVMYIIMVIHIAVSIWLGYRWIF
jgi:hypothetical protein